MLVIRREQMEVFQDEVNRDRLFPPVRRRLRELGLLPEAPEPESPFDKAREELLAATVKRAQAVGILTEDGIVQCMTYALAFGAAWMERPGVAEALARKNMSEDDRIAEVHRVLAAAR
jgi:hypothetical protein